MTNIKYTLVSEGIAEDVFFPVFLEKIGASSDIALQRNKKLRCVSSAVKNKSKVYSRCVNLYKEASIVGDIFIIGVDVDFPDHDGEKLKAEKNRLISKLKEVKKDISDAVIFLPTQVFDTWLLYQKNKLDNSAIPPANSLEKFSNSQTKKLLYGKSNPNGKEIEITIKKLFKVFSEKELIRQSNSFKAFLKELNTALSKRTRISNPLNL
jgi:hypothetical protein